MLKCADEIQYGIIRIFGKSRYGLVANDLQVLCTYERLIIIHDDFWDWGLRGILLFEPERLVIHGEVVEFGLVWDTITGIEVNPLTHDKVEIDVCARCS
jgi:hypothetical protein